MNIEITPSTVRQGLTAQNREMEQIATQIPNLLRDIEAYNNDNSLRGAAFASHKAYMTEGHGDYLNKFEQSLSAAQTANLTHIQALDTHLSPHSWLCSAQIENQISSLSLQINVLSSLMNTSPIIGLFMRNTRDKLVTLLEDCRQKLLQIENYVNTTRGVYDEPNRLIAEADRLLVRIEFAERSLTTGAVKLPSLESLDEMILMNQLMPNSEPCWNTIGEILGRTASEISDIEYKVLATIMLSMSIRDLEKLFNLHLKTQSPVTARHPDSNPRGMFFVEVDTELFKQIQGYMNELLWNDGSADEFARLFLVGAMMQTRFGSSDRNRFSSDSPSIIELNQSRNGAISTVPRDGVTSHSKHIGRQTHAFSLQHPMVAISNGRYSDTGTNITSNAVRIADELGLQSDNKFGVKGLSGDGTMVNALRHVVWLSVNSARYGETVSRKLGNAHEEDPHALGRIVDPFKHRFNDLREADTVADLLNNEIGINIGNTGENLSLKEATALALEHAHNHGVHVVAFHNGHYVVELKRILIDDYNQALEYLAGLDENGFPP